jgi:hypothetical protein
LPYGGDPIESFGDPKRSRPEFALSGLVIFLAEDLFDNGLQPRPFTSQLVTFWMLGAFGGLRLLPGGRADDPAFVGPGRGQAIDATKATLRLRRIATA